MRKPRWRKKVEARRYALAVAGLLMAGCVLTAIAAVVFA